MHAAAKAPASGGSYTLTWGLISIPVKLATGTERGTPVPRKQFTPDGHEVGSRDYDKQTGENYEGPILKKVLASTGAYVELTDAEMEVAIGEAVPPGMMPIVTFVPLETIMKEYIVEKQDQVRPATRKVGKDRLPDPAADKAFGLLLAAMTERNVAALVTIPRRQAACYGAILPDGRFLYLLFADQVRQEQPMAEPTHSEAELALGLQLIDSVGVDTPVLADVATAKVWQYIEAKAVGVEVEYAAAPEAPAPTIDLAAALAASLKVVEPAKKTAKKPVKKATKAA